MYEMSDFASGIARQVFDALPERVELIYIDYRDELDPDLYMRVLDAGVEGRDVVQDYVDGVWGPDYLWEAASEVVVQVAAELGFDLRAPYHSIESEEWAKLVEEVLIGRDASDPYNSLVSLAARDDVVLGVTLSDEWFDYGADGLAAEFDRAGADASWWTEEWERKVSGQGEGLPTLLVAVSGADVLTFARDLYVTRLDPPNDDVHVFLRGYDAGLLNRIQGSGWIEPVRMPFGIAKTMGVEEFLQRVWVDNRPGARGTWTELVGRAEVSRPGELLLVER